MDYNDLSAAARTTNVVSPIPVVLHMPRPPAIQGIVARAVYTVLMLAVRTWVVMLALGVAHTVWPQVPALGYWTVLVLILGLSYLTSRDNTWDRRWKDYA